MTVTLQTVISNHLIFWGLITIALGMISYSGYLLIHHKSMYYISHQHIVTTGIYAYIRHPQYTGVVIMVMALTIRYRSWLWVGILALSMIIIIIVIELEEKTLLEKYFEEYYQYTLKTYKCIPYIY